MTYAITHKDENGDQFVTTTDSQISFYKKSISVDVGDGEEISILLSDIIEIEEF